MSDKYKYINYKEICKFYWSIYFTIFESVTNVVYNDIKDKSMEEVHAMIKHEEGLIYGWLDKATWRLGDVEKVLEYSNEDNFFYYAMENFQNVRSRFESFLNESNWNYPELVYNYTKYDDLIEYYDKVKEEDNQLRHEYWIHYHKLNHRKTYFDLIKHFNKNLYSNMDWLIGFVDNSLQNIKYDYPL